MIRMYLRARGQVSGPVNAPIEVIPSESEDEEEEEDSNPWKRVKNDFEAEVKNEASTSNPELAMKEAGGLDGVNASANHSDLKWDHILEGL
ncbi:hypothetical protein AtNW77_Chr2g0228181 [Arabidopsis thaliana]